MAQSWKADINRSVCRFKKEVSGGHHETFGSGCDVTWESQVVEGSAGHTQNETFIVTTSQAVSKDDLDAKRSVLVDFLPRRKFRLINVQFLEKSITSESSLILFPIDQLHDQKKFSSFRRNSLQSDRSLLCHQLTESEFEAAIAKGKLSCFVISETTGGNNPFAVRCCKLALDGNGSYFLQVFGNKAELRTLKDFREEDKPEGSVILHENGRCVGLLTFCDDGNVMTPLLLLQSLQVGIEKETCTFPQRPVGSTKSSTNEAGPTPSFNCNINQDSGDGYSNDCGKNKTCSDNNNPLVAQLPMLVKDTANRCDDIEKSIGAVSAISDETSTQQSRDQTDINEHLRSSSSQPSEGSYISMRDDEEELTSSTEEHEDVGGRGLSLSGTHSEAQQHSTPSTPGRCVPEEGSPSKSGATLEDEGAAFNEFSSLQNAAKPTPLPPIQRSFSEVTSSPRSQRKEHAHLKSHLSLQPQAVRDTVTIKPDSLVADVIIPNLFVMGVVCRHLDVSYGTRLVMENWQHLASRHGVPDEVLQKCRSQTSNSEALFEVLKTSQPDLEIRDLKASLRALKMNNVADFLDTICLQDELTIDDFLDNQDPEFLGKVYLMLDQGLLMNWKTLGNKLDVEPQVLRSIEAQSSTKHNPTEAILEWKCASNPEMTIGQLQQDLKYIKRADVSKKLESLEECEPIRVLLQDEDLLSTVAGMLNKQSTTPHVKYWKHLAKNWGIPKEEYRCLQPSCDQSPTAVVLKYIIKGKPSLTVESLFCTFHDMKRRDVITAIGPYFEEDDWDVVIRKLPKPSAPED